MGTGIMRLHRVLKTKPERIYKALPDANAIILKGPAPH